MTAAPLSIPGFVVPPDHGPPRWSPQDRAWQVTRFADVQALLREPAVRVNEFQDRIGRIAKGSGSDLSSLSTLVGGILLFRNPPFHTRGRQLIQRAMAELRPALSEQALRPLVRGIVIEAAAAGQVEVMSAICNILPFAVLGSALGVSQLTLDAMRRSGSGIADACLPGLLPRDLSRIELAARDVLGPLSDDVARAAASTGTEGNPGIARILAINAAEFGFSEDEVTALIFFILLAGAETTTAFLGTSLFLLLAQPGLCRDLRADPGRIPAALEECLRIATPLRWLSPRRVPAGTRIGGIEFSDSEPLVGLIEIAHHDPAAYPDPGRFDINRRGPPHLAFALGGRSCLGAGLSRLQGRLLIETVLQDTEAELADSRPQWQEHTTMRRLVELNLHMKPQRKSTV